MTTGFIPGGPGPRTPYPLVHRAVMLGDFTSFLPGGGLIDSAKTRDVSNVLSPGLFTPGLLMGQVTATKRWANSVLGINQGAYTSGGTSVTVTPAQAAEIVRRIGPTGNLKYVGPPAPNGVAAVLGPFAYSAVNTGTGVITTASLGANLIAGGFVTDTDGSEVPKSFIFDGYGETGWIDPTNIPSPYVEWPRIPIAGIIRGQQLVPMAPVTDLGMRVWLEQQLSTFAGGKFVFDWNYQ